MRWTPHVQQRHSVLHRESSRLHTPSLSNMNHSRRSTTNALPGTRDTRARCVDLNGRLSHASCPSPRSNSAQCGALQSSPAPSQSARKLTAPRTQRPSSPPLTATQSENQEHIIRRKRMIDEFHRRQGQTNTPHEVCAGKIERLPIPLSFRRPRAAQTVCEQRSNSKTRMTPPYRTAPHASTLKTGSRRTAPIQPCRLIICPQTCPRKVCPCIAAGRVQLAVLVYPAGPCPCHVRMTTRPLLRRPRPKTSLQHN